MINVSVSFVAHSEDRRASPDARCPHGHPPLSLEAAVAAASFFASLVLVLHPSRLPPRPLRHILTRLAIGCSMTLSGRARAVAVATVMLCGLLAPNDASAAD